MKYLQNLARLACALPILAFAIAPTAAAQDVVGDGFAQTASVAIPAAFSSYATLSGGERVVFDGLTVDLYDAAGGFVSNLATMPGFVFNSFVRVDPSESFVICGESSNHDLFKIALDGSGMTTLTNLVYNYDASFEDANHIIVSAATCGFGCGNDLIRVNTDTGVTTSVAVLTGSSGPVSVAPNGDLYYGTVSSNFPAPPGSSDILVWTSAQTHSGSVLVELDATVFHAGLDGAAAMNIDPTYGNVFLAESIFNGTSRIYEFDKQSGAKVDTVIESLNWLSSIEFGNYGGNGHVHAYQPSSGGFLMYSDGTNAMTIEPQRPTTSISYSGNQVDFDIVGAKPNSGVLILWGPASNYSPVESSYQLSFDFLFHTGFQLNQIRRAQWYAPTDANGNATFSYFDFQNLAGTLVFQGMITDESGAFIGSTEASLN